ncbi:putative ankyrin repeat protein [Powai lake megavirus]|uniref:Putative ankyrin repeat protein n=1 Tax=Powai lake megavirus TaxID=1842663 RepID=A0A167R4B7_9VIRU|nr:putative ankyrin repeat protein [Powai lake megavirus]ANB50296.1 putative ankyrin repeat protein [Powai lake megavirus]
MQMQNNKDNSNNSQLESDQNVSINYHGLKVIGYNNFAKDLVVYDYNLFIKEIDDFTINEKICYLRKYMVNGNYEMFSTILNNGPDITTNDECIKVLADTYSSNNQIDCFRQLLNIGLDIHVDNDYPLVLATSRGNLPLIKFFVDNGADIATRDNICIKISIDSIDPNIFTYLLQSGSDIHCDRNYPLHRAVYLQKTAMVKKLLESGADISYLEMKDLVRIVQNKNYDLIKLLIDYGVDFSIINFNKEINPDDKYIKIYDILSEQGVDHDQLFHLLMSYPDDEFDEYA